MLQTLFFFLYHLNHVHFFWEDILEGEILIDWFSCLRKLNKHFFFVFMTE